MLLIGSQQGCCRPMAMNGYALPTFLGLGPSRTASTWLHELLDLHPQIHLTRPKECSFFGKEILRHDLNWYHQRFACRAERLSRPARGDISPWYSRLSERSVRDTHGLLPAARLILVLRNPIDRNWSQVLMERGHMRRIPLDRLSETALLMALERVRTTRYADYLTIIERWTAAYDPRALHLALYDELIADPRQFVNSILRHLGVDTSWDPPEAALNHKIYATRDLPGGDRCRMSEVVRWYLAMQWREPVRQLNAHLDGRLNGWVAGIDEVAGRRAPLSWRLRRLLNRHLLRWPERIAYGAYDRSREVRLALRGRKLFNEAMAPAELQV